MSAQSADAAGVAARRAALRRQRLAAPGAAAQAARLSAASRRVEPGFAGALSVLTGTPVEVLRRRGF